MPVAAVLLGQRAPGGEVVEGATFTLAERGVGQLTARRSRYPMHQLERRPLGRPCAVAVDGVDLAGSVLDFRSQPPHPAALGQVGEFGDRFDAQIQRVDETPRGRQVRRRLHRGRSERRVQGIDQYIVGTVAGRRPYRKVGQIGQIADSPRLPGPHAVELNGQTPRPAGAKLLRAVRASPAS